MDRHTLFIAALAAAALPGCALGAGLSAGASGAGEPGAASVVRVVDGDTIVARIGAHEDHVRLIGIDTPETVAEGKPVECFGPEAAARTAELLAPGTQILLERDIEARDRYNRLLAYVTRAQDGLLVNEALVAEGFARRKLRGR